VVISPKQAKTNITIYNIILRFWQHIGLPIKHKNKSVFDYASFRTELFLCLIRSWGGNSLFGKSRIRFSARTPAVQRYIYGFDTLSKQMLPLFLKTGYGCFFDVLASYLFTVIFTFLAIAYNLPNSTFSRKIRHSLVYTYWDADKSLAPPTSRLILFDCGNTFFMLVLLCIGYKYY
jgi:hypothetical protein